MKFISQRDYDTILKINQELVNEVLDTTVLIYKVNTAESVTNSYGESESKVWYTPVKVPCRVERGDTTPSSQLQAVDQEQECSFYFLRKELKLRNIYPEQGDVVWFDTQYYEIHNTKETQLWGGRVEYNHSIVCEAHLTRDTGLQLEEPNL